MRSRTGSGRRAILPLRGRFFQPAMSARFLRKAEAERRVSAAWWLRCFFGLFSVVCGVLIGVADDFLGRCYRSDMDIRCPSDNNTEVVPGRFWGHDWRR